MKGQNFGDVDGEEEEEPEEYIISVRTPIKKGRKKKDQKIIVTI